MVRRRSRVRWARPRPLWSLTFYVPEMGTNAIFGSTHGRVDYRSWGRDDVRSFVNYLEHKGMDILEAPALEIKQPQHVSHNHPVIKRAPTGWPRYVVTSGDEENWYIQDQDAYSKKGEPIAVTFRRPKSEWSAEDVYTFVKNLNAPYIQL